MSTEARARTPRGGYRRVINKPSLSKSRYISGTQCYLRLWYDSYARDLAPAPDLALQAVFDTGHEVGEMARRRFPGGHLVAHDHRHVPEALAGDASGHRSRIRARGVRGGLRARRGAGSRGRDRTPSGRRMASGRGQVDHPAQGDLHPRRGRSALGAAGRRAGCARGRGANPRPGLRVRRRPTRHRCAVQAASGVRRGERAPR